MDVLSVFTVFITPRLLYSHNILIIPHSRLFLFLYVFVLHSPLVMPHSLPSQPAVVGRGLAP